MEVVTYKVRVIEDGKVIERDTFKRESRAYKFVQNQVDLGHAVRIEKLARKSKFLIEHNDIWGISPHDTWTQAAGPLKTIFLHTSVTTQLGVLATVAQEREQMRSVDRIAHARGFNGFSYSFGVFPSGRAYEGRGFRVIEAATEDFNTSADSICTIGNTDAFAPTEAQIQSICAIIEKGQRQGHYAGVLDIRGHREVAPKACPGAKFTEALIAQVQRRVN